MISRIEMRSSPLNNIAMKYYRAAEETIDSGRKYQARQQAEVNRNYTSYLQSARETISSVANTLDTYA
jgi:hypothetical protein